MSALVGKALMFLGVLLVLIGAWVWSGSRGPTWLSWVGRLPGDIAIERDHVRFYFPIVTSLLLSVVLTILLWLFGRR
ncbi:MAG: DUF2905 domain-containing protein [Nitrospirota bacterium]